MFARASQITPTFVKDLLWNVCTNTIDPVSVDQRETSALGWAKVEVEDQSCPYRLLMILCTARRAAVIPIRFVGQGLEAYRLRRCGQHNAKRQLVQRPMISRGAHYLQ